MTPSSSAPLILCCGCAPLARWWAHRIIRPDVRLLLRIQAWRRTLPLWFRRVMDSLISGHPLYDASIVLYVLCIVAIWFVGWPLTWILVLNMIGSFVACILLRAPTPTDADATLRERERVSPWGFPCIELQVATALLAMVLSSPPVNAGLAITCGCCWLALLFLRVYALTHFLHQLVGSILPGVFSVPIMVGLANTAYPRGVSSLSHAMCSIGVGALVLAYVGYKAEMNEAPFFRIPRQECMCAHASLTCNGAPPAAFSYARCATPARPVQTCACCRTS